MPKISDGVTISEASLLPDWVINASLEQEYRWTPNPGEEQIQYAELSLEARDKAAQMLYEYLTEQQVKDLKKDGEFKEGTVKIQACYRHSGEMTQHPGVKFGGREHNQCVSFGRAQHLLLPICDRLLTILLAVRAGATSLRDFYG